MPITLVRQIPSRLSVSGLGCHIYMFLNDFCSRSECNPRYLASTTPPGMWSFVTCLFLSCIVVIIDLL